MEKVNNKQKIINIIKYANDPELWKEQKMIFDETLKKRFMEKEFVENQLSENFKNLIPNKRFFDNYPTILYKTGDFYLSGKFVLQFFFSKSKLFERNEFEIEVMLKNIGTNCSVTNKKELKDIFQTLLYRLGYEIGYIKGTIKRIELDIKLIRNEGEGLLIRETILDVIKIYFDYSYNIVKKYPKYYHYLFPFLEYLLNNNIIQTEENFYSYIADILDSNQNKNIDRNTIENRIKRTHKRHKKDKVIPVLFSDKKSPGK